VKFLTCSPKRLDGERNGGASSAEAEVKNPLVGKMRLSRLSHCQARVIEETVPDWTAAALSALVIELPATPMYSFL